MKIDPTLGVIIVAFIAPLATYLVAVRKLSGKIKDSEATELWQESRSIREWSMQQVSKLEEHVNRLESRLTEVEKANTVLAEENRQLTRDVYNLRNEIHELQSENESLTSALEDSRAEVGKLKWEAEHAPRRRASDPPITDEHPAGGE